jgi:hypothetical protein
MNNQDRLTDAMSDLTTLLVDVTTEITKTTEPARLVELLDLVNNITTNVKRIGDTVVLEKGEQLPTPQSTPITKDKEEGEVDNVDSQGDK